MIFVVRSLWILYYPCFRFRSKKINRMDIILKKCCDIRFIITKIFCLIKKNPCHFYVHWYCANIRPHPSKPGKKILKSWFNDGRHFPQRLPINVVAPDLTTKNASDHCQVLQAYKALTSAPQGTTTNHATNHFEDEHSGHTHVKLNPVRQRVAKAKERFCRFAEPRHDSLATYEPQPTTLTTCKHACHRRVFQLGGISN